MPVTITDNDLLYYYKRGDENALSILMTRHKKLVSKLSSSFYLVRWDKDDLLQEGMIALIKAINKYNPGTSNITFYSFAKNIIYLHMIGVLRKHTTKKQQVLNQSLPLENNICDDEHINIIKLYPCNNSPNPVDLLIEKESISELKQYIKLNLTELEINVLFLHIEGYSYREMASNLGRSEKSIDNSLTRIKKKLKRYLEIKDIQEYPHNKVTIK